MKRIFGRPKSLVSPPFPYCPGCSHGIVLRLIAEVIDELQIGEDTIGLTAVGCSGRAWLHLNSDMALGPHGRNPAIATAIKRCRPDKIVFSYQGEGDLMSIGAAEIVHAAARAERITVIMENNATFGATGGQQAPTTLLGQKTTSFPDGRDARTSGYPIRVAELLATLSQEAYIARTAVNSPVNIARTKRAIKKAFQTQMADVGFAFVEVLGICPPNLKLKPVDAIKWMEDEMMPYYPLGVFTSVARTKNGE